MKWVWYLSGFLIGYTYVGYPLLLWVWSALRRRKYEWPSPTEWPTVSFIVPAYNEGDLLPKKFENILELDYPSDKLEVLWVIEGSTDDSAVILQEAITKRLSEHPRMRVLGGPTRRGKPLAIEDALEHATGAIVVISDANTLLPKGALRALVAPFQNPKVGAVAGEKRVISDNSLTGEGESLYWRYESFIKRHMSQVFGCIGTVGELYAVRRDLYPRLRPNSYFLSEDLMVSMEILRLPSQVVYVPEAYSLELPALNLWEEFKRKVRVAAASFSVLRTYPDWLHFWKHPHLFFHFFSYKLLRWYGVPLSIPVFFISNVFLLKDGLLPQFIMALQVVFYLFAALGLVGVRGKVFGLPAYFMMANVAQILGVLRYFREYKSGKPYWQKIQRKSL